MSNSLLLKDHIYVISRKERLHNRPTKFKKIVNKGLAIIGLRWL